MEGKNQEERRHYQVLTIRTKRDVNSFIRFGWEVYKDNPFWVPPIVRETRNFLLGKGHFFKHCHHRLFVLKENFRVVATLAAFYDCHLVDHWKKKIGLLGFFEALPEKFDGIRMLFDQAEAFLREEGAELVQAPINGNIANPAGLLMNAYNERPVFLMAYNPSYYRQYFHHAKYYRLAKELLAFTVDLLNGRLRRKIEVILRHASERSKITIRAFNPNRFREESGRLSRIYAFTFKNHWSYTPQSEEELFEIMNPLKSVLESSFILFAENEGIPVGFVIAVPDYNPIIQKLNGRLNLFNALSFFRMRKKVREARLIAIGVVPEWRGKNVAPFLAASVYHAMIKRGYTKCEYSWVFRENVSSQDMAKKFYSDVCKTYVVYQKDLTKSYTSQ